MSDYGADKNPSIPAAQNLAYIMGFMPQDKTNVMQWTYPGDVIVRKLANKTGKSNCLFKFAPPPPDPVIPPDLPPVPAGNACTLCWGDGQPFGVGETPESVTIVVQDIEKGPLWLPIHGECANGTYVVPQIPARPCIFSVNNGDVIITWRSIPLSSQLTITKVGPGGQVFRDTRSACATFYENTQTGIFTGGTVTIFIPPIS